jgi:hypothetical protein
MNPVGYHAYRYVDGNPVGYRDPFGFYQLSDDFLNCISYLPMLLILLYLVQRPVFSGQYSVVKVTE